MVLHNKPKPSSSFRRLCRKLFPKKEQSNSGALTCGTSDTNMFRRVFEYFDKNGDGKISASELQSCIQNLSEEEAEIAVSSSDMDGDGKLGFEDFQKLMMECSSSGRSSSSSSDEEEVDNGLKEAFRMYETEPGSGFISASSLKRMLKQLGDDSSSVEDCEAMIRAYDLNGDGRLNFHEFSVMMRF